MLTGRQLEEWRAYWKLEPFGHRVDHQMQAQMAVMMAAINGIDAALENYMPTGKQDEDSNDDWDVMFPGVADFAAKLAAEKTKKGE